MIKSINYQANQIAAIEISDAEDVQSLGDSWGYGSTARVTGKIESEYMYTPQGWIKTSSGGSGDSGSGGVLVVHTEEVGDTLVLDKTWKEITDAGFAVWAVNTGGPIEYLPLKMSHDLGTLSLTFYGYGEGDPTFVASEENDYPSLVE